MGTGKTYSTKYLLDSNNSSGVAGQVLISTSTGVNWSDGSDITGGPYLPLTAGSSYPLTGDLYLKTTNDASIAREQIIWQTSQGTNRSFIRVGGSYANNALEFGTGNSILGMILHANAGLSIGTTVATTLPPASGLLVQGNVGIGTTSPDAKLDIEAAINPTIRLTNSTDPLGSADVGTLEFFTKDSSTAASRVLSSIVCVNSAASPSVPDGQLIFKTSVGGSGAVAATEKMRIDSSGNTTFTSTSPQLTIKSTNAATGSGTSIGKLAWYTSDATTPTGVGNVTTMETKSTTSNGSDYAFVINKREGSGGGSCYMNLGGNSNGSISFGTNTSGAGTERMRIDSAGAIKFNAYGAGTLVTDTNGNITVSSGGGAGGPFLPLAGGTMTGTSGIEFPDSFKLKWKSVAHSTEVFSITSVGDTNSIVSGDGTNSVKTKIFVGDGGLDINSNDPTGLIAAFGYGGISLRQSNVEQLATTSSGISVKGGDKGQPGYTFIGDTNTGMYSDTADQLDFATGGNIAMVIDSSSNVGIGTTSPGDKLEVYGDAANIAIVNTQETDAGIVFRDAQALATQAAAIKFNSSDQKLKFFVNDEVAQRMVIDTNGNVGIGATSPGNKLEVTGIIEATVGDTGGFAYGANPASKQGLMISVSNTGGDGFSGAGRIENTSTTNSSSTVLVLRQINSNSFSTITQYRQGSGTQGNLVGFVRVTTTNTIFSTSSSDERLKKNITNWTDDTLGKFKALQPKKFRYKIQDASAEKTLGFIAQNEVANFPEAYVLNKENEDDDAMYSFNPMGMTTHLMKAIKDLVEKVEILENKITQLEN